MSFQGKHEELLSRLAVKHRIRTPSDWKRVATKDVYAAGGRSAMAESGGSMLKLLEEGVVLDSGERLYAHQIRKIVPRGYWSIQEHVRAFLNDLVAPEKPSTAKEWMRALSTKKLRVNGGGSLLLLHKGSIRALLASVMPELDIEGSSVKPRGYWAKEENQREFLESIAGEIGVKNASDWKKVSTETLRAMGAVGLLNHAGGKRALLQKLFPDTYTATPPRRASAYWEDEENCRVFMRKLAVKHGVQKMEDWQTIRLKDVLASGGVGLLGKYNWALGKLISDVVYPDEDVDIKKIRPVMPKGYWKSRKNCRRFFEEFAAAKGITQPSDWQRVTVTDIKEAGGGGLLSAFNFSLLEALRASFGDDYNAVTCRATVQRSSWTASLLFDFFETSKAPLGVSDLDDWLRVSREELASVAGGYSFLANYSLLEGLRIAYPNHQWPDTSIEGCQKRSTQRRLYAMTRDIFLGSGPRYHAAV